MNRISENIIEQIRVSADIVDVISTYIELKKRFWYRSGSIFPALGHQHKLIWDGSRPKLNYKFKYEFPAFFRIF